MSDENSVQHHGTSNSFNDEQVASAMEQYFAQLETGKPFDRDEFVARHPEIAEQLSKCLDGLDFLHNVAPQMHDESGLVSGEQIKPLATVGDFRINREIGRGGMGVVYEAEQLSLGRRVALKVLPFAAMLNDRQLHRFQNEARAAATLHHPNIVPVHSVGSERGLHYYTMQYIEGPSLADVLRDLKRTAAGEHENRGSTSHSRSGSESSKQTLPSSPENGDSPVLDMRGDTRRELYAHLSTQRTSSAGTYFRTVTRWGIQTAEALAYSHENGVVHRNIKPGNLLIDRNDRLWVTDFGLARLENDANMTTTGDVVGTLRYMSPEQVGGKGSVADHRADLYSLGASLYELLTLRPAFDGSGREQLLQQITQEDPCPLRRLNPAIPIELETIVLKAMSKNAADRYATAQEMADDLKRYLENRPIRARRPTITKRVTKWTQRHRVIVVCGVFVLLLSVIALAASNFYILQQKAETERQFRIATSLRLAAQSQSIRNALPIQSLLLAMEATNITRRDTDEVLPLAQESLRQALSSVGGRPLLGHKRPVNFQISTDGRHMGSSCEGEIRLWDLTRPWNSDVILRGQRSETVVRAVSSNGRLVVTGELDSSELQLWDFTAADPLTVLRGHSDKVWHATFSADDRWLATAGQDNTVRLWDLNAEDRNVAVKVLQGHLKAIWAMAISPDSRRLATGTHDGTARLWDLTTEDPNENCIVLRMHHHESAVRSVAFSPDNKWLATGCAVYGENPETAIKLWKLTGDNPAGSPLEFPGDPSSVETIRFSPNGRWLVAAGSDGTAHLLDVTATDPAATRVFLRGHQDSIWDVAISNDSHWIVTSSYDKTARMWNLKAEDPSSVSLVLRGHEQLVGRVYFTPDSQWIITSSWGGNEARIWNIAEWKPAFDSTYGSESKTFQLDAASQLQWGPSQLAHVWLVNAGTELFTASSQGEARLVRLSSGSSVKFRRHQRSERRDPHEYTLTRLTQDGRWLAMVSWDGGVDLWDMLAEKRPDSHTILKGSEQGMPAMKFSPNGRWLATTSRDRTTVNILQFSPDGRWLATGVGDRTVSLWDLNRLDSDLDPLILRRQQEESDAVGSTSNMVLLWRLDGLKRLTRPFALRGHEGEITTLAFSSDSRSLATGSADRSVRLWDIQSEDVSTEPFVLHGHEYSVRTARFHNDRRWLITASFDSAKINPSVRIWDLSDDQFWTKPFHLDGHRLLRLFSPNGQWLATSRRDGVIQLWDLSARSLSTPSHTLRGHQVPPRSIAFSPDGHWLASIGGSGSDARDYALRLWDLSASTSSRRSSVVLPATSATPVSATFTPDSLRLIAGYSDGQIRTWELRIERMLELAKTAAGRELTLEERERFIVP